MAEAFFNHLAKGKAQAVSAGTNPASGVDPTVIELMNELGVGVFNHYPKKLNVDMLNQVDKVITMGCGVEQACPATFTETEDWGLEDPDGRSKDKTREISDQIKVRVEKLLKDRGI